MNEKASEIGMKGSYIMEPSGFNGMLEHQMAPLDIVQMMIAASSYENIIKIWPTREHVFSVQLKTV